MPTAIEIGDCFENLSQSECCQIRIITYYSQTIRYPFARTDEITPQLQFFNNDDKKVYQKEVGNGIYIRAMMLTYYTTIVTKWLCTKPFSKE